MTRILHISPTYYSNASVIGGGEKYVVYMARSMIRAAIELSLTVDVSLLAFGDKDGVYDVGGGLVCHLVKGRPWDAASLEARVIHGALAGVDFVFVHQCLSPFGIFVAAQARIAGTYVVGLDHGGGESPLVEHTFEVGRIFDLFLAYSNFGARAFSDLEGSVVLIRGPVDTDFYVPIDTRRDPRMVLSVGRIMPHKGFDRIISALPSALKLTIVGSCYNIDYFDYLMSLVRGDNVKIIEGVDDLELLSMIQPAGLFVHASTHIDYKGIYYSKPELLGLAPLEALACGIPTLVSSAGSLPELADVKGCLVFHDDAELVRLLSEHASGVISWPDRSVISEDLADKFGLRQFGLKLLTRLGLMP